MEATVRHLTEAAQRLVKGLGEDQRAALQRPFAAPERLQWSYFPGPRGGLALDDLDQGQRKLVLGLVSAALRVHAFAQVATIMAFEDVLDLAEGGRRQRHRSNYWTLLFGTPGEGPYGWRFEGHHVSINVTVTDSVAVTPLFLGVNPAVVEHAGATVLRPLAEEEEVARALLRALPPGLGDRAWPSREAPPDIRTRTAPFVAPSDDPGVALNELDGEAARLLGRLVDVYVDRLPAPLADRERARLMDAGPAFRWQGGDQPGQPHYYRLTGPGLLLEYDNTQNGANHIHTVWRDPAGDFGADLLREHYAAEHDSSWVAPPPRGRRQAPRRTGGTRG